MTIMTIQPSDVLSSTRRGLGLPSSDDNRPHLVDKEFLAALLRRSAGFLCPCSAATLQNATLKSLRHLVDDEDLEIKIEDAIEGLVAGGDLLELNQVAIDDPTAKGTWLFAAPPCFVVRPGGSVFLTGIVADQETYLPMSLSDRICHEGYIRTISPNDNEDLIDELSDFGLRQVSKNNWLKSPRSQSAEDLSMGFQTRLKSSARSGAISDLQLLDSDKPVTYYRGRWTNLKRQSGMFVGRRPQEYGSPIWCFIEIESGEPKKLLDFPLPQSHWRGCDVAWHLQMAMDYVRGEPQCYRSCPDSKGERIDFFSPLPLWAQRRLMIIGRSLTPKKCLMSYWIPREEFEAEEKFLQEQLYLVRQDEKN